MMRIKKMMFICVIILLVLTSLVLASSKPISGEVSYDGDFSDLVVKVYFVPDGFIEGSMCVNKEDMVISEEVFFSTNLQNFVVEGFLSISCQSLWGEDDKIWFEVKHNSDIFESEKEAIISGTGLQSLNKLVILEDEADSSDDSSGDSSRGSSGGSSNNQADDDSVVVYDDFNPGIINQINEDYDDFFGLEDHIQLKLDLFQDENLDEMNYQVQFDLDDVEREYVLNALLFSMPDHKLIKEIESSFVSSKEYVSFGNFSGLETGWYQIQVILSSEGQIITTSNFDSFIIKPELFEEEVVEEEVLVREQVPLSELDDQKPIGLVFVITLLLILFIIMRLVMRKDH